MLVYTWTGNTKIEIPLLAIKLQLCYQKVFLLENRRTNKCVVLSPTVKTIFIAICYFVNTIFCQQLYTHILHNNLIWYFINPWTNPHYSLVSVWIKVLMMAWIPIWMDIKNIVLFKTPMTQRKQSSFSNLIWKMRSEYLSVSVVGCEWSFHTVWWHKKISF